MSIHGCHSLSSLTPPSLFPPLSPSLSLSLSLALQAIVKLNCNLVSVATLQDKVTTTVVN